MENSVAFIAIFVALAIGLAFGWFFGNRPAAGLKADLDKSEEAFKRAAAELGTAQIENATLKANAENFDKQIAALKEAREDLLAQFKATGGEVLSKAQEEFLKAATERFGHAEAASKEAVKALLEPVHQRLKSYEEQCLEARGQAGRQLRPADRTDRDHARRAGGSAARGAAARQFADQCPQGARPLGRAGVAERARTMRAVASTPISTSNIRSTPRKAGCGPTPSSTCPARRSW